MRKAIKKHPVISTFIILIVVFFVFIIYKVGSFFNEINSDSLSLGEKIAVIEITGVLLESKSVIENIQKAKKDKSIKAIVIRINSPGGGVAPSQDIYREIVRAKKDKPVIASLSSVAASGGYYIACAADKILASPGSLTGSIGVIMNFSNMERLFEKIGLKNYVIKSGKYKDIGSPLREMTANEKNMLQAVIDNVHAQFIGAVAEGRVLAREKVETIADGRIFSGEQAVDLGLVDKLGNLQDSVLLAARTVGIKGDPKVVYLKKKKGIVEYIFNKAGIHLLKDFSLKPLMPQLMYVSEFL